MPEFGCRVYRIQKKAGRSHLALFLSRRGTMRYPMAGMTQPDGEKHEMYFNVMSVIFGAIPHGFVQFRHRFAQTIWDQIPENLHFVSFLAARMYGFVWKCMQNPWQPIDFA